MDSDAEPTRSKTFGWSRSPSQSSSPVPQPPPAPTSETAVAHEATPPKAPETGTDSPNIWVSRWGVVHQAVVSSKLWPFAPPPPELDEDDDMEVVAHNRHADLREARAAVEASVAPLIYAIAHNYRDGQLLHYELLVTGTQLMATPIRYLRALNTPKLKHDDTSLPGQQIAPTKGASEAASGAKPDPIDAQSVTDADTKTKADATAKATTDASTTPIISPSLNELFRLISATTKCRLWFQDAMYGPHTPENHIYLLPTPKAPKRVVLVAINQWVPPKYARRFAGPLTLASRLLEETLAQVKAIGATEITAIAIDGLDTIDNSVAHVMLMLEPWHPQVAQADLVVVVAAGGAAAIAVKTVANLYVKGVVLSSQLVGVIIAGGYLCGPRLSLDLRRGYSPVEADVIGLWCKTAVTEDIAVIVRHQGKITLVCDPYDDIVAPDSAWATTWSHPHIYRVLISRQSGRLACQVMKLVAVLRNRGVAGDHGVVSSLCGDVSDVGSHLWLVTDADALREWIKAGLDHVWTTTSVVNPQNHSLHVVRPPVYESLFDGAWSLRAVVEEAMTQPHILGVRYLADIERARSHELVANTPPSRLAQALLGLPVTEIDQWWT